VDVLHSLLLFKLSACISCSCSRLLLYSSYMQHPQAITAAYLLRLPGAVSGPMPCLVATRLTCSMHLDELLDGSIFQSGQPNITTVALTDGLCAAARRLGAAACAAAAAPRHSSTVQSRVFVIIDSCLERNEPAGQMVTAHTSSSG
jgi:hypothetical protein